MLYCNLLCVTATSEIGSTTTLTTILPGPHDQVTGGKHLANLPSEIEEEGDLKWSSIKEARKKKKQKNDAASVSIYYVKVYHKKT